jgi:hypothetical protein
MLCMCTSVTHSKVCSIVWLGFEVVRGLPVTQDGRAMEEAKESDSVCELRTTVVEYRKSSLKSHEVRTLFI